LQQLLALQVLEDTGEGMLRFVHDKLREVAYESLDPETRKRLHRRAGETLEATSSGKARQLLYPTLAHHFVSADERTKARQYLELAGEQALENYANREAVELFSELLALERREHGESGGGLSRRVRC